jgi:hypothetical protein
MSKNEIVEIIFFHMTEKKSKKTPKIFLSICGAKFLKYFFQNFHFFMRTSFFFKPRRWTFF